MRYVTMKREGLSRAGDGAGGVWENFVGLKKRKGWDGLGIIGVSLVFVLFGGD